MNNMVMSSSIVNISKALLAAQKQMGSVIKDSKNPFFKSNYATLNAVREASNPQLNENGISVLQPTVHIEGKSFVRTLLLHESGEFLGSDTEIVCAKQNDPQALGSAISYARRYGLQALLGLAAEDDDGEKAMVRQPKEAPKAPTKAAEQPKATTPVATTAPTAKPSSFKSPVAVVDKAETAKVEAPKPVEAKPAAAKNLDWN